MKIVSPALDANGNKRSISDIADIYFDLINPKTKKGEYKIKLSVIGRLERQIALKKNLEPFFIYLLDKRRNHKRLKEIITATPEKLEQIIRRTKNWLRTKGITLTKDDKIKIIRILGYQSIRKNKTNWILRNLNIKTCPYCTTQFLLKFESSKIKKSLCELDHFYPKMTYPFLSVSFYNLIPSCSHCNKSKGDRETKIKDYIHPYIDDYDSLCSFKTDSVSVIRRIVKSKKTIGISLVTKKSNSPNDTIRVDNHNIRFNLEDIYKNHSDVAEELYWRKLIYTSSRKKELLKLLKALSLSEAEINRFITGNYMEEKDLLKRPLAKLVKDISKEIKLIP